MPKLPDDPGDGKGHNAALLKQGKRSADRDQEKYYHDDDGAIAAPEHFDGRCEPAPYRKPFSLCQMERSLNDRLPAAGHLPFKTARRNYLRQYAHNNNEGDKDNERG